MKRELVRRAIAGFIAVSITASHWGLFYTSGNIKQLDGGGERWALRRLLLALIYLFVQQEARRRPPAITGLLSQRRQSRGSMKLSGFDKNPSCFCFIVLEEFLPASEKIKMCADGDACLVREGLLYCT